MTLLLIKREQIYVLKMSEALPFIPVAIVKQKYTDDGVDNYFLGKVGHALFNQSEKELTDALKEFVEKYDFLFDQNK